MRREQKEIPLDYHHYQEIETIRGKKKKKKKVTQWLNWKRVYHTYLPIIAEKGWALLQLERILQ